MTSIIALKKYTDLNYNKYAKKESSKKNFEKQNTIKENQNQILRNGELTSSAAWMRDEKHS